MSNKVLMAEGLTKSYGEGSERTVVLRGVSLSAEAGELVAVVGPSGAGKTTLLYLLGGLARPSSGSIMIGGIAFSGLNDAALSRLRNKSLGFVFQSHNLLPELNAVENVALAQRIGGKKPKSCQQAARQVLQELGLGHRLKHKPGELSGGEQQRVALARALVCRPDVLLADEPTGNLDRVNSEAVFEMLFNCAKERGQAVVMVTHNDELAGRADRVLRMRDGRVVS
jgi:lipoprotein-releasing system ATP-binding protein